MTRPKILVVLLSLASVVAIGFAFFYRVMAGVFLYDSNFETFQHVLTANQKHGITWSLDSITSAYSWLLAITNVFWMVTAWYLLSRLKAAHERAP
ncbi:MAG: hypothetical protein IAG10_25980 [Planctomycetaceae bacterium]|nr:hypothetical protein [Planctomycetaceae bacterium]